MKIASAMITNLKLVEEIAKLEKLHLFQQGCSYKDIDKVLKYLKSSIKIYFNAFCFNISLSRRRFKLKYN